MRLIFIYGPPAVGKLTTARCVAESAGYALCHNHLTVDAVRPLFPEGDDSEVRSDLLKTIRLEIIRTAARLNIDTVITLAYSGVVDDDFVDDIVAIVERYAGTVTFVQLYAPAEVLLLRATAKHRVDMGKISDPDRLRIQLGERDHYATMRYPRQLRIDTTELTPAESARRIVASLDEHAVSSVLQANRRPPVRGV